MKQGDGAADFKPIAHLYKTQVFALAEHLGVPEEIRRRPPTTDTFSLAQTQEEFYFALPYHLMDLCLWAHDHGVPATEVAPVDWASPRPGGARLPGHRGQAAREPIPSPPADPGRGGSGLAMCGIAGIVVLRDGAPPPGLDEIGAMVGAIRHRGPGRVRLLP